MRRVLTVGVYDYFHLGHLRLFKQCKEYGDFLIVAVQDGQYIHKYKPNSSVLYSTEERIEIINNLREVNEVIVYSDVDKIVKEVEFDVLALGEDQRHEGFSKAEKWCVDNGKKVVRLKRTQGISSSDIKDKIDLHR